MPLYVDRIARAMEDRPESVRDAFIDVSVEAGHFGFDEGQVVAEAIRAAYERIEGEGLAFEIGTSASVWVLSTNFGDDETAKFLAEVKLVSKALKKSALPPSGRYRLWPTAMAAMRRGSCHE